MQESESLKKYSRLAKSQRFVSRRIRQLCTVPTQSPRGTTKRALTTHIRHGYLLLRPAPRIPSPTRGDAPPAARPRHVQSLLRPGEGCVHRWRHRSQRRARRAGAVPGSHAPGLLQRRPALADQPDHGARALQGGQEPERQAHHLRGVRAVLRVSHAGAPAPRRDGVAAGAAHAVLRPARVRGDRSSLRRTLRRDDVGHHSAQGRILLGAAEPQNHEPGPPRGAGDQRGKVRRRHEHRHRRRGGAALGVGGVLAYQNAGAIGDFAGDAAGAVGGGIVDGANAVAGWAPAQPPPRATA